MTVPFKLRILRALTDAIKTVTPATGYDHNLADYDLGDGAPLERVWRGRAWFGDSDVLPMVSVLEGVNPADEVIEPAPDDATGEYDWTILVQGFVEDDPSHPTDPAYYLLRDVRRVLARELRRKKSGRQTPDPLGTSAWAIPGCALVGMTIGPGVVRPADDVSAKAYFWLTLTLRIVEDPEAA